jgi:hypothetical protein
MRILVSICERLVSTVLSFAVFRKVLEPVVVVGEVSAPRAGLSWGKTSVTITRPRGLTLLPLDNGPS